MLVKSVAVVDVATVYVVKPIPASMSMVWVVLARPVTVNWPSMPVVAPCLRKI